MERHHPPTPISFDVPQIRQVHDLKTQFALQRIDTDQSFRVSSTQQSVTQIGTPARKAGSQSFRSTTFRGHDSGVAGPGSRYSAARMGLVMALRATASFPAPMLSLAWGTISQAKPLRPDTIRTARFNRAAGRQAAIGQAPLESSSRRAAASFRPHETGRATTRVIACKRLSAAPAAPSARREDFAQPLVRRCSRPRRRTERWQRKYRAPGVRHAPCTSRERC